MTLGDFLRVVRNRWRIAVAVTVLGIVAAAAIAIFMPPSYETKVDIFFTSSDPTTNVSDRVAGYGPLVTSDSVTTAVVNQLRLPESPQQFADHVTVTTQPNSPVLTASVQLSDPAQAAAAANAVATSFIDLFGRLEVPPAPGAPPAVSAKLVQPAAPPVTATWPSALTLLVGLAVGLVLGIAAAGLRHSLDPKIRSRDDLASVTGHPVLGEVPTTSAPPRPDVGRPPAGFRRLRTVLRRVEVDGPPRTFAIAGATTVPGRAAVSVDLASALAQGRSKVLLIEADLRHPQVSHRLGLDTRTGLATVLSGSVRLAQAVRRCGHNGLWILSAGTIEHDSGDLLGSSRMAELLAEVREQYDVVILDTAPLLDDPGAVELASVTDGVVLLVGRGSTRKKDVREAIVLLEQIATPVLGTVLSFRSRRRGAGGPDAPAEPAAASTPTPAESPSSSGTSEAGTAPSPGATTSPATSSDASTAPRPSTTPRPSRVQVPSTSATAVESPDRAETTAETPTRSLISLRSAAPGGGAASAQTGTRDEAGTRADDAGEQQGARGDSAVPATENGPKA